MKVIEVVVSPQGETTIQTRGFAGPECQQASKWIEQSLGAQVGEQKTPEYFAPVEQQNEVKA
jgi:Protein of unknown function (DUF2997)